MIFKRVTTSKGGVRVSSSTEGFIDAMASLEFISEDETISVCLTAGEVQYVIDNLRKIRDAAKENRP